MSAVNLRGNWTRKSDSGSNTMAAQKLIRDLATVTAPMFAFPGVP